MKKIPLVLVILFVATLVSAENFKVMVDIKDEESYERELKSYIGRELRTLGDVDIVYDKNETEYIIDIVVLKVSSSGIHAGYAVSANIILHSIGFINYIYSNLPEDFQTDEIKSMMFYNGYASPNHNLYLSDSSGLAWIANKIVLNMDVTMEIVRELIKSQLE